MPRSEEWSKKAWKWQEKILQKLKWSEQNMSYTLEDLMAFGIEWPKMIMPEQGWLGDGESVSFCGGEALVGLGVRSFKRIAVCPWEDNVFNSMAEIKKKAIAKHIIPLTTMGELRHANRVKILRIQSEDQVYTTMAELWMFHPRFAMPNKTFTLGNVVVKKLQMIELKREENGCVNCYLKALDRTVAVPMKQRGDFTIVEDETSYTLQQVYDNFNLPQRVRFESHPAGMNSTDVILISETRYDVLISCVTASLYVEDEGEKQTEPWGTKEEDFVDVNFIFLPKPVSEESPLADMKFFTWIYDPEDPVCQVIMERASVFDMERFKDINVAINASSKSMSAVKQCTAENIYDYIKVHDFIGDYLEPSSFRKSPEKPADSPSETVSTISWLHSGTTKASANLYEKDPSSRPQPEKPSTKPKAHTLTQMITQGLKKSMAKLPPALKRNKSESDTGTHQNKLEKPHKVYHTLPREVDYKMKTEPPMSRNRQGSLPLPPVPYDGLDSEDDQYDQVEDWENQAKKHISERGRLPLPGEVKKGVQSSSLPKPPSEDIVAKLRPVRPMPAPRPQADVKPIELPPPRPPKPGKGPAVVQGQTSVVQSQVAAIQGQVAVVQGQANLTQGQVSVTKGKVAVVQGQPTVSQGQVAVAKGKVAVVQGQVPKSCAPGGPRRIKFPPPNGNLTILSELTTEQLAMLFKYFNLDVIAEQLKSNKVDGAFFENSLESEDFAVNPFFATDFQRKQIERIRNGQY